MRWGFDNQPRVPSKRPITAPLPVPSFNTLSSKPPPPTSSSRPRKQRKHNQLGLTPKTEEHESSEEDVDADVDEEVKLAGSVTGELRFSYRGRTSTLGSTAEVAAWIEERKRRFPTRERVETKKEEEKREKDKREEKRQQEREEERKKKEEKRAERELARAKVDRLREKLARQERKLAQAEDYTSSSGSDSDSDGPEQASSRRQRPDRVPQPVRATSRDNPAKERDTPREKDREKGKKRLLQRLLLGQREEEDRRVTQAILSLGAAGLLDTAVVAAESMENAFQVPPGGYHFTAGHPTTLTWKPSTQGTVTIKLQMNRDITPGSGIVLGGNLPNSGSFSFVPMASLVQGKDYTIEIIDDTNPINYNFTPTFTVDGATGRPSGTPTPTHSTSSSTSTSDSSTMTTMTTTTTSSSETSTSTESSSSTESSTESESSTSTASSTRTSGTSMPTGSAPDPNGAVSLALPGGLLSVVLTLMALL
ncbi:uncharacterized protein GIQ15_04866 [Arthroderma uncinatum]|uniref:uncharacterized protein n=1 Tax=Arthroderma uncinatum TaxID=74035 RepID=UPI00144AC03B|nr:uncharacterized protein GIQ15_04866 [Arthroderma uncinatum]KAF3482107.1 hypothetical protein GIQ15_04866 [Arthroderma uncinatum]